MASGKWGICALLSLGVLGCGSDAALSKGGAAPSTEEPSAPSLTESELRLTWQQIPNPTLNLGGEVFATQDGWFSLSSRLFGPDAKSAVVPETYLYRSDDGVRWRRVPLPHGGPATPDNREDDLMLRDLTFADGRLVLVGARAYSRGVVLTSDDGNQFQTLDITDANQSALVSVTHAGGRFFAFGTQAAYGSADAKAWQLLDLGSAFLPWAVVHGSSFLIAGNGGLALSSDGATWTRRDLDCSLPSACITDPSGNSHPFLQTAFFSRGRFYVNHLVSEDGVSWQPLSGPVPSQRAGDFDIGADDSGAWFAWKPDAEPIRLEVRSFPADDNGHGLNPGMLVPAAVSESIPPPPEQLDWSTDDGRDCTNSRCLVLDGRLYLAR